MKDKLKSTIDFIQNQSQLNKLEIEISDLKEKLFKKECIIVQQSNEINQLKRVYDDLKTRNQFIYENKIKRKGSIIKIAKLLEKKIEYNLRMTDLSVNDYIESYTKLIKYLKEE